MTINIPENAEYIMKALRDKGFESYAVGGCVRDSLMGKEPCDWDITTSALPEQTGEIFEEQGCRVIKTGIKHGTVTVLKNYETFEVTTFRIDGKYTDRRRPDGVFFTPRLEEDLKRRDFTINAITADCEGEVKDFFDGIDDIEKKVIRAIGDPDKRLGEDALRIMRALRFSAVLGFDIAPDLQKSLRKNRELLNDIASERIRAEFSKLICGKDFAHVLLNFTDIIEVFIPEITPCVNFDQKNIHHIYDVWEHSVRAAEAIPADPVLRLTMLFHDIEKPSCFFMGEDGQGHFYGHAKKSAETAERILRRLKFDNKTIKAVTELIALHDVEIVPEKKPVLRRLGKMGDENFQRLMAVKYADNAAQSPIVRNRREDFKKIEEIAAKAREESSCISLRSLSVNGRDLTEAGFPEGREIGKILRHLLEGVIDGKYENEKEALLKAAENFRKC